MLYFLDRDFWYNPALAAGFIFTVLLIIFLRYVAFAALYNAILKWLFNSTRLRLRARYRQVRREIQWSFLSSVVFSLFAILIFWAYQQGYTRIYTEPSRYSWVYFFLSPFLLLVLYESYYYWLHRLMHHPRVYRVVHSAHHESIQPTVFASFAFHPIEAMLQASFFPLALTVIPFHYTVILAVLMLMTFSAIINHSGVEVFRNRILLRHLIGSSHHDRHHAEFRTNFGLYFTWWDKWMKTESKKQG